MAEISSESIGSQAMVGSSDAHSRLNGRALWLARLAWLLVALLVFAALSEMVPSNFTTTYQEWLVTQARPAFDFDPAAYESFVRYLTILESAVALLCIIVGFIIFRFKSDDGMGLFVSATLLMLSLLAISANANVWRFPGWLGPLRALSAFLTFGVMASFLLLFHLFPDGRFVPRWTRWTALPGLLGVALLTISPYFLPQSWLENSGNEELGWLLFSSSLLFSLGVAILAQVYRYQTAADPAQRQQMKWVILGLIAWLSNLLWSPLIEQLLDTGWDALIGVQLELITLALVPMTIGLSILRYRLWDVDIVINRTLVYGTLTAVILGLYGLAVGVASALAPSGNDWLVAILGLFAAAAVAVPLRRRLQALVDRWLPAMTAPQVSGRPGNEISSAVARPLLHATWLAWVVGFGFLAWRLIAHIAAVGVGGILSATRIEWAVQESLKALPAAAADGYIQYLAAIRFGAMAIFWLVAILVFWRKRDEWMALYVSFVLMLFPFGLFLDGQDPLFESLSLPVIGLLLLMLHIFPDGRFVPRSRKWRGLLLATLLVVPVVAFPLARAAYPNSSPGEWAYSSFIFTMVAAMTGGVASQLYRYRHMASPVQRQQTKWVLFGMGLQLLWAGWAALWLGGLLPRLNISQPVTLLVTSQLNVYVFLTLPLTIGVAMLRYRLWDVDALINRTLVFAGLTALVAVVYVLVVGLLGIFFQAGGSVLLSVLATGLIAILFNPLRLRLQREVNRLMYGERDDPVTALSRLGQRLESAAAPDEILPTLAETVGQTLRLPYVAVAIREGDSFPIAAEYKTVGTNEEVEAEVYPLVYQSELVGQLLVSPRASNEPFTPADRRLLENVARQAGAAVHAAQLTAKLQRSRQHLVAAREEERRRLRRDLHDGLGPQLATLSLKIDATRNHLEENIEAADHLLVELKSQVQDAIRDVRRLVYDLRPPALDQLGLVSALRQHAASHNGHQELRITIDAPAQLPPLPAAVEVAAYRIALEAMTNVTRHAGAQTCTIRLWIEDGLQLEVSDNGRGLPSPIDAGMGLISMQERAAELGGSFVVESGDIPEAGGTVVRVHLPLMDMEQDHE